MGRELVTRAPIRSANPTKPQTPCHHPEQMKASTAPPARPRTRRTRTEDEHPVSELRRASISETPAFEAREYLRGRRGDTRDCSGSALVKQEC